MFTLNPHTAHSGGRGTAVLRSKLRSRCRSLLLALGNLGIPQTAFYALQRLRNRRAPTGHRFVVLSKRARHPLHCRSRTSDLDVFGQIFVQREYRCLDGIESADLVIDCGANVGYSAAYFLSRYPASSLICVEPDPGNYAALESNLKPYQGRVKALLAAVWSEKSDLVLSDAAFGDGREWARTVRCARSDEAATIPAIDIGTLIRESGRERVSILKIDVEGAEEIIFSSNHGEWLDKIDNLVIELHGERCERVFNQAIAGRGFQVSRCDELTVCTRAS